MANLKKPKCKQCKFWEYTKTLGSPIVPVWHCRSGFTPWADALGDCIKRAERKIKEQVMNFCSGECAMNEQCSREG